MVGRDQSEPVTIEFRLDTGPAVVASGVIQEDGSFEPTTLHEGRVLPGAHTARIILPGEHAAAAD